MVGVDRNVEASHDAGKPLSALSFRVVMGLRPTQRDENSREWPAGVR